MTSAAVSARSLGGSARLRVGILAPGNSRERGHGWSATSYYMAQAVQRHCGDVVHLGPVRSPVQRLGRIANRIARTVARRPCDFTDTWLQARDWARLYCRRLDGVDLVLATSQTVLFALLETTLPIVYTSDATFNLVHDYYPFYTGLPRWNSRAADQIERQGLQRAALISYPSDWAATSAREDYSIPAEKIHVIPYGANFDEVPTRAEASAPKRRDVCRLLFVAADWNRKGGEIAYQVMQALRAGGCNAELVVVGCDPPRSVNRTHVTVFRHLRKDLRPERTRLSQLYLDSHFLLLPTRADCTPHVFCEASAHGTPSIATATGGVAGAVVNGENGFLLQPSAGAPEYAALIDGLFADRAQYQALVGSSRSMFEERLNWDHWGRQMAQRMSELPTPQASPRFRRSAAVA